jgi:ribokinase
LTEPRIMVVGSYATGLTMKVDRLPCSGETLLGSGYRVDHGGKGSNQAVACARLGARVSFVAKIGNDAFGDSALKLYREEGVNTEHVIQTGDTATGVGFIIVEAASGHNCITIDPGANELLSAAEVAKLDFSGFKVVLTQLEIPVAAAEAAMARGREHSAVTILNPAPVRPLPTEVLKLVEVLTPNETEAKVLAGERPDCSLSPEEVAKRLINLGVKNVVMTLGERGALMVTSESVVQIAAIGVKAVDTTGAGDAFNAGLAVSLGSGASLEEAVRFAVIAGGLAVTKEGVIPSLPRREEVASYARE